MKKKGMDRVVAGYKNLMGQHLGKIVGIKRIILGGVKKIIENFIGLEDLHRPRKPAKFYRKLFIGPGGL